MAAASARATAGTRGLLCTLTCTCPASSCNPFCTWIFYSGVHRTCPCTCPRCYRTRPCSSSAPPGYGTVAVWRAVVATARAAARSAAARAAA
eukprot:scaffold69451_cov30-Phaeocystis_antarctica.AAC.1